MIGLILRVLSSFWGYPYQLHPDEGTIVNNVINMLSRHSWEAYVYNRPDQFEIKCNAIIFTIYSWIKYNKPAYEIFEASRGEFFVLARLFSVLFGTAIIPMMYALTGKVIERDNISKVRVQIIVAIIVTFSPMFISNSALATPDIPLTFFVLLATYFSILYLEKGKAKYIYIVSITTGVCISIKYPAAVFCFFIALIVVYRAVKEKNFKQILKYGLISISIILITIFVIAPNLFTDISTAINVFIQEARPNHLGADGLGFWGNTKYYLLCIRDSMGSLSFYGFMLGVVYLIKNRAYQHLALLVSGIYWICLSMLSLHWLRWGFPMYTAYIIISVIGYIWLIQQISFFTKDKKNLKKVLTVSVYIGLVLIISNTIISGGVIVKNNLTEDSRIYAMDFCVENNITKQNSIYEGHTPLTPDYGSGSKYNAFEVSNQGVQPTEQYTAKKYFVLSNSFKDRYLREPEKYPKEAVVYGALDKSFNLIYRIQGVNYSTSPYEVKNIISGLKFLTKDIEVVGGSIYVYNLNPRYVKIRSYTYPEELIFAESASMGSAVKLSEEEYIWAIYEKDTQISFVSQKTDLALDVTGAQFVDGTKLELWEALGGDAQRWKIQEEENYCYILSQNNMALSIEDNMVVLKQFDMSDNQKWILEEVCTDE